MRKLVQRWFMCYVMQSHDWTSAALEGVPPPVIEKFWEYARMYCRRCGVDSKLNKEAPWKV